MTNDESRGDVVTDHDEAEREWTDAERWLAQFLADGPQLARATILYARIDGGHDRSTTLAARDRLGVVVKPYWRDNQRMVWVLPGGVRHPALKHRQAVS